MLSTPSNPFLYRFEGKIPALKNGKEVYPDWEKRKIRVQSNPEVNQWYNDQPDNLKDDIEANHHLDKLARPFVVLELYAYAALYPLDTDNVYTTVQELLQPVSKREKGFLNIVDDDKYVEHHLVMTHDCNLEMPVIGAYLWVWENDPDAHPIEQLAVWQINRRDHLQRYKKPTLFSRFAE